MNRIKKTMIVALLSAVVGTLGCGPLESDVDSTIRLITSEDLAALEHGDVLRVPLAPGVKYVFDYSDGFDFSRVQLAFPDGTQQRMDRWIAELERDSGQSVLDNESHRLEIQLAPTKMRDNLPDSTDGVGVKRSAMRVMHCRLEGYIPGPNGGEWEIVCYFIDL